MLRTFTLTLLTTGLAACASRGVPADRIVYAASDDPSPALVAVDPLDDHAPPPPADDISEADRRAWLNSHPEPRRHVPFPDNGPHRPAPAPRPRVDDDSSDAWWAVPLFVGAGYGAYRWKRHLDGHHHHHSHWNIGVGTSWWWGRPYWDRFDVWAWR